MDSEPESFLDNPSLTSSESEGTSKKHNDQINNKSISNRSLLIIGLIFFFIFLLFKLPDDRIQEFLVAHMKIQAQNAGLGIKVDRLRFTLITGPRLKFTGVDIHAIDDETQDIKIQELIIRPELTSLFFPLKKFKIFASIEGNGEISGELGLSSTDIQVDLDISNAELGKMSLLKVYTYIEFNCLIDGKIKLAISQTQPQTSDGNITLELKKLKIPAQSLMGFTLPEISISQSLIALRLEKGHLTFNNSHLGKDITTDDITATITGDGTLMPNLDRTQINLKVALGLAPRLIQKLPILESLMASARGANGKYTYSIYGPLYALESKPGE